MNSKIIRNKIVSSQTAIYLFTSVIVMIFFADFYFFSSYSIRLINYPFQLDYGEGAILWQIERIFLGFSLYDSINEYPFTVSNYPPLYHVLTAALASFEGDILRSGRIVSYVSSLVIASSISVFVLRASPSERGNFNRRFSAVVAGLIFFTLYPVQYWTPNLRVDFLAVSFAYFGLAVFSYYEKGNWVAYLSALGCVLAVFTKQNTIAVPVACFLTMWFMNRSFSRHFIFACFVLGTAPLAFLIVESDGEFIKHVFLYNGNSINFENLYMWVRVVLLNPSVAVFSIVFVIFAFIKISEFRKNKVQSSSNARIAAPGRSYSLIVLILVLYVVAGISSLSIIKVGSNFNYLIEFGAAVCVGVGLLISDWLHMIRVSFKNGMTLRAVFLLSAFILLLGHQGYGGSAIRWRKSVYEDIQTKKYVLDIIKISEGEILSEDMTLSVLAKKGVSFQPFIMTQLSYQGMWDQELILSRLRQKYFSYVVLTTDFWPSRFTPEIKSSILNNYRFVGKFGEYRLYKPSEGVLMRIQGVGTFVAAGKPQSALRPDVRGPEDLRR